MKYAIVIFSSRSETMQFYKIIKNFGLYCTTINTPKKLSASCGISTKIDLRLVNDAKRIVLNNPFSTFKGIYMIELIQGNEMITRLF